MNQNTAMQKMLEKIRLVIGMWKDPANEMDGLHTLKTLEEDAVELLDACVLSDEWISIKDSLPNYDVPVLILSVPLSPTMDGLLKHGISQRVNITGTSLEKDERLKELLASNSQFMRKDIIQFWMPLPKAKNIVLL